MEYNPNLTKFRAHFDADCDYCGTEVLQGDDKFRTPDNDYICEGCAQDE